MLKVYGISGKISASINIDAFGEVKVLEFKGGCLDRKSYKPALYSTDNPVLQTLIEVSPLYGNTIFLYETFGEEEKSAPIKNKVNKEVIPDSFKGNTPKVEDMEVYEEVDTNKKAIAILKEKGLAIRELTNKKAIIEAAERVNVSFPNLEK